MKSSKTILIFAVLLIAILLIACNSQKEPDAVTTPEPNITTTEPENTTEPSDSNETEPIIITDELIDQIKVGSKFLSALELLGINNVDEHMVLIPTNEKYDYQHYGYALSLDTGGYLIFWVKFEGRSSSVIGDALIVEVEKDTSGEKMKFDAPTKEQAIEFLNLVPVLSSLMDYDRTVETLGAPCHSIEKVDDDNFILTWKLADGTLLKVPFYKYYNSDSLLGYAASIDFDVEYIFPAN